MNLAELIFGQLFEGIYFSLFLILTKNIKEHKLLFTILTAMTYVILFNLIPYDIWSHILFFLVDYLILRLLYKNKSQITDIFTLNIAGLVLMIICIPLYFIIWKTINNLTVYIILTRIFVVLFLFMFRNKLCNIQKLYKSLWNRQYNNQEKCKMKSTTFRAVNVVIFNLVFFIINISMLFMLLQK